MTLDAKVVRKAVPMALALIVAAWALKAQLTGLSWQQLTEALKATSPGQCGAALALTMVSFLCLGLYDTTSARLVAPWVPGVWSCLTGMLSNAVSNTLGFHAVTGTLVRARMYGLRGASAADALRIASLTWLALGLGFVTMVATSELARGVTGQALKHLWVGLALTGMLLGFLSWLAIRPRTLSMWRWQLPMPSGKMALQQMGIGAIESASALGALYVLVPPDLAPPFSVFAVGCMGAIALGIVSSVPGGLGVFEASVIAMLSGAGRSDLAAALLLYRAIYNLVPFVIAAIALGLIQVSPINWKVGISRSVPVAVANGAAK